MEKLKTTQTEFEELWAVYDRARTGTINVKAPRLALTHLLLDHHALLGSLEAYGVPAIHRTHQGRVRGATRLYTAPKDANGVKALIKETRKNAKLVELDKKLLFALLADHGEMIGVIEDEEKQGAVKIA